MFKIVSDGPYRIKQTSRTVKDQAIVTTPASSIGKKATIRPQKKKPVKIGKSSNTGGQQSSPC